jgi:hypothetical protein
MALNTSVLTGGSNNHTTTSEEVNAWATDFVDEGIVSTIANTSGVAPATGGFAVNATGTPDTNVQISAGIAYVQGTPTSQTAQTFRVKNSATATLAISANASGSTKYDWIYIKLDATKLNAPDVAGDDAATLVASRSSSSTSDDGTPPTYGYPIAVVTVANGFSTITNGNIRDVRTQTTPAAPATASSSDSWASLGATPSSVVYDGNRTYTMTFTGNDLTDTVSAGMYLRGTRTVAAPTQCADLESGSSQYYSKSSPSGMTFTDDFTVGAWIKLESYGTTTIASRYNGTSGWNFYIDSSGRVNLSGNNANAANFSLVQSYQAIPLNKWVHVAAQLDMSAFTATSTTSYVMIGGQDVLAAVSRGGTNPTALVQAGNLEIGSTNGGGSLFDGKLAQVFVSSAKITQANVRTLSSQGITAALITTHSIISAYSFSNSIADLNTGNANDLTANGSALATSTDSPFGGQADGTISSTLDYGKILSAAFSSDTTLVVKATETNTFPASGGISAVSYSTQYCPYGLPNVTDVSLFSPVLMQASFNTASTTQAVLSGLTGTGYVPFGRRVRITATVPEFNANGANTLGFLGIWSGTVGSGRRLALSSIVVTNSGFGDEVTVVAYDMPLAGNNTYNVGINVNSNTAGVPATAIAPAILAVEYV